MSHPALVFYWYLVIPLYMEYLCILKVDTKKLSVLLFIHGGDNADGMGAMFDGDVLAAYGQIIVVTINYRISVLGMLRCMKLWNPRT